MLTRSESIRRVGALDSEVTALLTSVRRRSAPREGLLAWSVRHLPHYFSLAPNRLHVHLDAEVARAERERGAKVAVVGSRGSGKSTPLSLAVPLRAALEGTEPYVQLFGEAFEQAELNLRAIKHELETNASLRAEYPGLCGGKSAARLWRDEMIVLKNGSMIEALGSGKTVRGKRAGEHRPTLQVLDDVDGELSSFSSTKRARTRAWFERSVLKAGTDDTNVFVIGNAIHRECVAMNLLTKPVWRGSVWPSIATWPKDMGLWEQWESVLLDGRPDAEARAKKFYLDRRARMDEGAVLLWPERESLYRLMVDRAVDGHSSFANEKQCDPVNPELCEWPGSYFDEHAWVDRLPTENVLVRVAALDPSKGRDARRGDYQAKVVVFVNSAKHVFVKARMDREDMSAMCHSYVDLCLEHDVDAAGCESNAMQELLLPDLEQAAKDRGATINFVPVQNKVSKPVRIRRLTPYLAQRRIHFVRGDPGTALCAAQARDFPQGDHDDGPDALEMAIRLAVHVHNDSARRGELPDGFDVVD